MCKKTLEGFDASVNDTVFVGFVEGVANVSANVEGFEFEATVGFDEEPWIAREGAHDDVHMAIVTFPKLKDANGVRVFEPVHRGWPLERNAGG